MRPARSVWIPASSGRWLLSVPIGAVSHGPGLPGPRFVIIPVLPNPGPVMTIAAKFEIEYLQYLDPDGKAVAELPKAFKDPKALLPLFKQMLYVRTFDTKAIALQRTGKLGTYAACLGHEATHIGIGASMRPEDVFAKSDERREGKEVVQTGKT